MTGIDTQSLRFRFIAASLLWLGLATLLAGVFIASLYRSHTTQRFTSELGHHQDELIGITRIDPAGRPSVRQPLADPLFLLRGSGYYWQVEQPGGVTVTSPSLGGKRLDSGATPDDRGFQKVPGPFGSVMQHSQRATPPGGGPPLIFTIAGASDLLDNEVARLHRDLAFSLIVFAALMAAGIMLQIRFGLRPVRRLGDWIEALRRGQISRLPESDVPSEFLAIVTRLNQLLDAQATLVSRARVETGNLAHNLRTPLALIGDEAEQLARAGRGPAAAFILDQCALIQRQIDYHMMRAAAAGTRGTSAVTAVAPLIERIVEAMRRLHAERGLRFDVQIEAGLDARCDPGDLSEIVSNLIDNGCKWAASRVSVSARAAGQTVRIAVADDGPGIPHDKRSEVLDVGVRLDPSTPGTGLGLAISRDMAMLYGGEITLEARDGGGLVAAVELPA
ncbi:sensor histidine kinase [Sphingomonas quercus]|uniref:histidine kinase n=1 Tax=Sphingomonas quercus TaxID=2842451 RepID=A0ABS6BHT4_9SPHN|nr:HAMP domain-containing sensor histidine kinase [Sphingomonas quercus]MBU3076809.1 HAMP domain-containing histidine kinase [Sphingomonas quercus]